MGGLTGALHHSQRSVKQTRAHHHFHKSLGPSCALLGGHLPSFLLGALAAGFKVLQAFLQLLSTTEPVIKEWQ